MSQNDTFKQKILHFIKMLNFMAYNLSYFRWMSERNYLLLVLQWRWWWNERLWKCRAWESLSRTWDISSLHGLHTAKDLQEAKAEAYDGENWILWVRGIILAMLQLENFSSSFLFQQNSIICASITFLHHKKFSSHDEKRMLFAFQWIQLKFSIEFAFILSVCT